jgi:hypothetical protein
VLVLIATGSEVSLADAVSDAARAIVEREAARIDRVQGQP